MSDHHNTNRGAEINFGDYRGGGFSVAVSTDSTGRIVDLGTADTLRQEYGYDETVGEHQGFASIHRQGTSWLVRQRSGEDSSSEYQELTEGSKLLSDLRSIDSAPVALGHIYLVRILRTGYWAADTYVKMLVVAYQADQSVTVRWEVLAPE